MTVRKSRAERVIDLDGPQGNAYFLLGTAQNWARQIGIDPSAILDEMRAGDYTHLVRVFNKHFGNIVVLETNQKDLLKALRD